MLVMAYLRWFEHGCSVASFHHWYTAGNDFPHSRQNSFERDVINSSPSRRANAISSWKPVCFRSRGITSLSEGPRELAQVFGFRRRATLRANMINLQRLIRKSKGENFRWADLAQETWTSEKKCSLDSHRSLLPWDCQPKLRSVIPLRLRRAL
jgi:hypothetical protein